MGFHKLKSKRDQWSSDNVIVSKKKPIKPPQKPTIDEKLKRFLLFKADKLKCRGAIKKALPPKMPYAIGTRQKIVEIIAVKYPEYDKKYLNNIVGDTLRYWCNRYSYLKAIIRGNVRYSIEGSTTPIKKEEKDFAKQKLKHLKVMNDRSKKAAKNG